MSRKTAREAAFKLVYQRCVNDEIDQFSIDTVIEGFDDEDVEFIKKSVQSVNENYDFLQRVIESLSKGFRYDRIYKVDLALMLVAANEIFFDETIPPKVSVNEAVELAKVYSDEKSANFINGLLASVIARKNELITLHEDEPESAEETQEAGTEEILETAKEENENADN